MIDESQIRTWVSRIHESETLEFKAAANQYDLGKAVDYTAAIANEGGGHLVLGVSDSMPRQIEGTRAFAGTSLSSAKQQILNKTGLRVEITEVDVDGRRVVVFTIPARPRGRAVDVDGRFWMRSGESLVPMTFDRLKEIGDETADPWLLQDATPPMSGTEALGLLDAPSFFELLGQPYPSTEATVVDRLVRNRILNEISGGFALTNLGALTLGRRLSAISDEMMRRAPRMVIYDGPGKFSTKFDTIWDRGYASGFAELVGLIVTSAPNNTVIEQVIRDTQPMFPEQSVRELVANAMVHQDLRATGNRVMVEMYSDRLEITNPGSPAIAVDRFIDDNVSRNVELAELMRKLNICEEKGSGIDKVVNLAEIYQLPAPNFRTDERRTIATLFAHREFEEMTRDDRVRACYQHCVLKYILGSRLTNQTLRGRFGLGDGDTSKVTSIINAARDAGLVRLEAGGSTSLRYARYVPFWA